MVVAKHDARVCWITGNYTERTAQIERVKEHLGKHELFSFHEEDLLSFVLMQIEQFSCFSDQRLVILNGWPEFKGPKKAAAKKLISVLSTVTSDCVVILNNLKYDSKDPKDFKQPLNKIARVYHFADSFKFFDAVRLVSEIFEKKEKSIDRDDATLLVDSITSTPDFGDRVVDPDRLFLLIKKLEHFLGERKRVQREDVINVCIPEFNLVIWQLFPLLDNGDYIKSLALIHDAIKHAADIREVIENMLIPILWRYRLLLMIREKNAQHVSKSEIIRDIQSVPKLKREGLNFHTKMNKAVTKDGKQQFVYSYFAIEKAIAPASVYPRNRLLAIRQALGEAILKVRSTNSDSQAMTCFESVIMLICNVWGLDKSSFLRKEIRYI